MTKYSTELKIKIVSEYLTHQDSMRGLSKNYNIDFKSIREWIHQAQENGLESLEVKHTRLCYSPDFKLNVVRYYLNNLNLGMIPVATKFNISSSQVYTWVKQFEKEGIAGLLPKRKGRPPKVPKKPVKQAQKILLSEIAKI